MTASRRAWERRVRVAWWWTAARFDSAGPLTPRRGRPRPRRRPERLRPPVLSDARGSLVPVRRGRLAGDHAVQRGHALIGALHGRAPARAGAVSVSATRSASVSVQAPQSPPPP